MWYQMQFKELFMIEGARHDSAQLVEEVFSNVWMVAIYVVSYCIMVSLDSWILERTSYSRME